MKIRILISVLFLTYSTCFAQNRVFYHHIKDLDHRSESRQILDTLTLNKIRSFSPDSAKWLYQRWARAHVQQGQYSQAGSLYETKIHPLLSDDEDDFSLRAKLLYAYSLYNLGHFKKAENLYKYIQKNLTYTENNGVKFKAYLNYSLIEWDIGRFEEYKEATLRALKFAAVDGDSAPQSLAHANLSEYYGLTGNWPEALNQLHLAQQLVNKKSNLRKWIWLCIRQASIEADNKHNYKKAILKLEDMRAVSDQAGIYAYWKIASYKLVNLYFQSDQRSKAPPLLLELERDRRIQNNINDNAVVKARIVELYTLSGDTSKINNRQDWLRINQPLISNVNARLLDIHARALLAHAQGNKSLTKELATRLFQEVAKQASSGDSDTIFTRLSNIYQQVKLDNKQKAKVNGLIRKKAVTRYIKEINGIDWVYKSSVSFPLKTALAWLILAGFVASILRLYFQYKKIGYAEMVTRIEE